MATTLDIFFMQTTPIIYVKDSDSATYECDGKEGVLHFNGYFYVEDEAPSPNEEENKNRRYSDHLPIKMFLHMKRREKEPYKVEKKPESTTCHYNTLEEHIYYVEIYRRIKHDNTSQYGPVDIGTEEEPDIQNVCFYPTCWQTIHFRVLEERLDEAWQKCTF